MENFTKEQIVPDVISSIPGAQLKVQWNGKDLEPGAQWTPTQVKDQPFVHWEVDEGAFYTMVMTDPDAPSRSNPVNGEILHWMVINIPGNDISKGEGIVAYRGSGAPQGTGLHRYCFFVFKQSGKIQVDQERADRFTVKPRRKFKIQSFVDEHDLGTAVAGNFFMAEYDDYVRIARAQIKDLD